MWSNSLRENNIETVLWELPTNIIWKWDSDLNVDNSIYKCMKKFTAKPVADD